MSIGYVYEHFNREDLMIVYVIVFHDHFRELQMTISTFLQIGERTLTFAP